MANIIEEELKEAKKKMIETRVVTIKKTKEEKKEIVTLTRNNVAIVEAMIRNDSAYIKSHKKDAQPTSKYNGSTAYWMSMLRAYILNHTNDFLDQKYLDVKTYFETLNKSENTNNLTYAEIIEKAVIAVDNENSTHINSDGVGRHQITNRIVSYDKKELLYSLWEGNLDLFKKIEEKTKPEDDKHNARTNTSFASKFCHYACFYLFEGSERQDNFSIHDNILRTVLPWYLEYYNIKINGSLTKYEVYRKAVDSVREKANQNGNEITSRNGFDHLLWYYHKGRL